MLTGECQRAVTELSLQSRELHPRIYALFLSQELKAKDQRMWGHPTPRFTNANAVLRTGISAVVINNRGGPYHDQILR